MTRTFEHFGNFDTGLSVYSGFNSEGTNVASDRAPADTEAEIPTQSPAGVAGSESAPSVSQTENGHENTVVSNSSLTVLASKTYLYYCI